MGQGPQLTETLAHLVWGDVVQPLWSGLTWPEMCARSFSLCRDSLGVLVTPAGVSTAEGCGSAAAGIPECCPACGGSFGPGDS